MAKKTQVQLLEEMVELLTPIANLAKFNISQINQQIAANELAAKEDLTAEEVK